MAVILAMAAALWGLGAAMGTPWRVRWVMIGVLWASVVLLHLLLPVGHPLRLATGESAAPWLLLGAAVALVLGYRWGLQRLRARVGGAAELVLETSSGGPFTPTELNRYARHIVLREIGGPGQRRLKDARVLVIGAGGLGSPALLYLAASGVGTIGVIDDDAVEGSNLQRQVIHTDARIGMPKVFSAEMAMRALNPFIVVRPYHRRLTDEIAEDLFAEYDLILDGTDNFDTRYLSNAVAHQAGKPLISGALSQWEGQVSLFDTARGTPCYACVFPQAPAAGLAPSCAEVGVFAPLPGMIGALMAAEAVKRITGAGETLGGVMMIQDALYADSRRITLKRNADCPVCGSGRKESQT